MVRLAKPFFVLGLPRSRTAWLSVFLTTGESLCRHEALSELSNIDDLPLLLASPLHRYIGLADTALGYWAPWLVNHYPASPIVIIERNIEEVYQSLAQLGFPRTGFAEKLMTELDKIRMAPNVMWVNYQSLEYRRVCQDIFWHCLPSMTFDQIRWMELNELQIESNPDILIKKIFENSENLKSLFAGAPPLMAQ